MTPSVRPLKQPQHETIRASLLGILFFS
uniref:Uncharacterized protein n=1 Tax=Lotus japonicus TaxID=34305 RepID=I3T777_LOTJA|nr:unknown [Lotus japonicus]